MIFPFPAKEQPKDESKPPPPKVKGISRFSVSHQYNLCMLVTYVPILSVLFDLCNLYFSFRHSSWFIFPDLFFQYFENMADNIFSRFPVQLALLQRGNNRRGWKEKNNPSAKVRIVMITIFTMMITTSIMNFQRKAISSLHHRLRTPPLLCPPHHFITRTGSFT